MRGKVARMTLAVALAASMAAAPALAEGTQRLADAGDGTSSGAITLSYQVVDAVVPEGETVTAALVVPRGQGSGPLARTGDRTERLLVHALACAGLGLALVAAAGRREDDERGWQRPLTGGTSRALTRA